MSPPTGNGIRHATARWLSDPPRGAGHLHSDSHAFEGLLFSIPDGELTAKRTTPGELLAAAYSAFMASYLALQLDADGVHANELVVDVWCDLSPPEQLPRGIEHVQVGVRGRVERIEGAKFEQAAEAAWATCMRSLGLRDEMRAELDIALV